MVVNCINFCVDELLWMIAWGWYQLAFGIVFTWLAYMMFGKIRMVPAFVLSLSAYGFSVLIYFACVAGVFVNYFQTSFSAGGVPQVYGPLHASLVLAVIYSVLQLFFYWILNYWHNFAVIYFFLLSFICNILAALAAASCIKVTF